MEPGLASSHTCFSASQEDTHNVQWGPGSNRWVFPLLLLKEQVVQWECHSIHKALDFMCPAPSLPQKLTKS